MFVHDKKGNAFDGTAWSSDGKSLSIEVNNGILVCLKMYYENGKIAIYSTLQQRTCYDKDGNEISETDFRAEIDSETLSRLRMASMELEKR